MSGFSGAGAITLIVLSGFGGYQFGVWREREKIPEYQAKIVSEAACEARIKMASSAILDTFGEGSLIHGVMAVEAGLSRRIPENVLNFCAEVFDLSREEPEFDRFRR